MARTRLLRRRDIVAMRGKDDYRSLDLGQVDPCAVVQDRLAACEPVADEQIFDDPAHFIFVHEIKAGPPVLKAQKFLGSRVHMREDVIIFAPPMQVAIENGEQRSLSENTDKRSNSRHARRRRETIPAGQSYIQFMRTQPSSPRSNRQAKENR